MTPMFTTLVQCVGLDAALAQRWWQALTQARWSVPQTWRRDVEYFDQRRTTRTAQLDAVLPFLRTTCTPQRVLTVLESLVKEDRLRRDEATAIATHVLACVTALGRWTWDEEQDTP